LHSSKAVDTDFARKLKRLGHEFFQRCAVENDETKVYYSPTQTKPHHERGEESCPRQREEPLCVASAMSLD
jgi:hypothetical protein